MREPAFTIQNMKEKNLRMKIELNTSVLPIVVPDTYGTEFCYEIQEAYWCEFKQKMVELAVEYIKTALKETIFKDAVLTPQGMTSPKWYNFTTDRADFFIEFNDSLIDRIKDEIKADEVEFFKWTKEKYHSYDGFISFMPYEFTKWWKAIDEPANAKYSYDKERAISMYIMYKLRNQDFDKMQDDYLDDLWDYASQNGMEVDYEEICCT